MSTNKEAVFLELDYFESADVMRKRNISKLGLFFIFHLVLKCFTGLCPPHILQLSYLPTYIISLHQTLLFSITILFSTGSFPSFESEFKVL